MQILLRYIWYAYYILILYLIDDKISISTFIEFVCLFVFYDNSELFYCINSFFYIYLVILSLANSHSNRVIHKSNVIRFLKILGCKEKDVESCQLWLDGMAPTDKHGYVNLSSFIYFINSCSNYLSPLQYVRAKVINEVIGDKTYFNILNRKVFYESCIGEGKVENPPKEPCIVSFYRIIFTQEPDPYHCDYKPFLLCKTADECLNDIRKRYGYATRPTRDINVSLFSSRSLKLKHSNSTTSNSSLLCEKNHLSATLSDSRAKFKSSSISSKVIDLSANGIIISKAHSVIPKLKVKRSNKIVDSSTIL